VSFNVHGIVYVSEQDAPTDPLDAEVRKMSELLERVKDEQSYIVVRERTHRNTAESTNSRVKWWNLFVIGVVIGESVFQVWWLRRFFEVRFSTSTSGALAAFGPWLGCLGLTGTTHRSSASYRSWHRRPGRGVISYSAAYPLQLAIIGAGGTGEKALWV
jgi:hypothetical protein